MMAMVIEWPRAEKASSLHGRKWPSANFLYYFLPKPKRPLMASMGALGLGALG